MPANAYTSRREPPTVEIFRTAFLTKARPSSARFCPMNWGSPKPPVQAQHGSRRQNIGTSIQQLQNHYDWVETRQKSLELTRKR